LGGKVSKNFRGFHNDRGAVQGTTSGGSFFTEILLERKGESG